MKRRLLIGLLSAGLVGAMLPGVAAANDLVGAERGLRSMCETREGDFRDNGLDLQCGFDLTVVQRGDPSTAYPAWQNICESALGRVSDYTDYGGSPRFTFFCA